MLQTPSLSISLGQASSPGPKACNDDFFGALLPEGERRNLKGCMFAIADGISSSKLGREAAETCVKSLFADYMTTPDTWTVRTAGVKVISALNAWLHAQSNLAGESDPDFGYTCTLTALILKGRRAHIFHVGDSRLWRLTGSGLEPLTHDHRARLDEGAIVLSRAMGAAHSVDIEYRAEALSVGDIFLLTTDGLHEAWDQKAVLAALQEDGDLEMAAQRIVAEAEARAADNVTLQVLRIDSLPREAPAELESQNASLPILRHLAPGKVIDGFTLIHELHSNNRSEIYLASARDGSRVVFKAPAGELKEDPAAISRFVAEEWIARRVSNPHILTAPDLGSQRSGLYSVTNYIEGQTLRQWMFDNPEPELQRVREIVSQIIKGLRAFHRREMLHQDLRPENVMIDQDGHVTLIDFGSAFVSGVQESGPLGAPEILGTAQYTAPEYFAGEPVDWHADLFSLGVMTYEMVTGRLPYGTKVSQVRSRKDLHALNYLSAGDAVPAWLDHTLARAVHPDPTRRHTALSEFEADLRRPSVTYLRASRAPLIERFPVGFWKTVSAVLAIVCLILVFKLANLGLQP